MPRYRPDGSAVLFPAPRLIRRTSSKKWGSAKTYDAAVHALAHEITVELWDLPSGEAVGTLRLDRNRYEGLVREYWGKRPEPMPETEEGFRSAGFYHTLRIRFSLALFDMAFEERYRRLTDDEVIEALRREDGLELLLQPQVVMRVKDWVANSDSHQLAALCSIFKPPRAKRGRPPMRREEVSEPLRALAFNLLKRDLQPRYRRVVAAIKRLSEVAAEQRDRQARRHTLRIGLRKLVGKFINDTAPVPRHRLKDAELDVITASLLKRKDLAPSKLAIRLLVIKTRIPEARIRQALA
jgi:hypothetical protein